MASKFANTILDLVVKRINNGTLRIPSMQGVAGKIHKQLKRPGSSMPDIIGIMEHDPLVVAEVVRFANVGLYGSKQITGIESAVMRLGEKKLLNIISDMASRTLFESQNRKIQKEWRALWEHSLAVAIIARDVSALSGFAKSDQAYVAGLLHDIGKPVVAAMLLEAEAAIAQKRKQQWVDSQMWMQTVLEIHRDVAMTLAEEWNLPQVVETTIKDCSEYDPVNRVSIPNFVRFSNALSKQQGLITGPTDPEETDALVLVGRSLLGIDDDSVIDRLIDGLKQRVRAQIQML